MWIGALLFEMRRRSSRSQPIDPPPLAAGHVTVRVLREQSAVPGLVLRFPAESDFDADTARAHAFYFDRPFADRRRPLSAATAGQPPAGLEMTSGISGHLRLDIELDGPTTWPIDQLRVLIREYRRTLQPSDVLGWELDPDWHHIGTFPVRDLSSPLTLAFLNRF